jgi:hypothetical protein
MANICNYENMTQNLITKQSIEPFFFDRYTLKMNVGKH